MRIISGIALFAILVASGQAEKRPVPQFTFELHAGKVPGWRSEHLFLRSTAPPLPVIAASADGQRLFALIPQQNRRWELQRLSGWQTGAPQVERLEFDGDDSSDPEDFVRAEMLPRPGGQYLLVRILVLNLRDSRRSAVIVLVDLHDFRVAWRRPTVDPLLANSEWRFIDRETLVAVEGPAPILEGRAREYVPPEVMYRSPVAEGSHRAAAVSLKNLEERFECHYSIEPPAPTEPRKLAEYSDDVVPEAANSGHVGGSDCGELEKAAGAQRVEDLPVVREMRGHIGDHEWLGCTLENRKQPGGLALYDCRQFSDGRMVEEKRVRTAAGVAVLSISVKPYDDNSSTLVSAGARDYVVLLRTKLRVEVYAIP